MDETSAGSHSSQQVSATQQSPLPEQTAAPAAPATASAEHRQAYGTAKTENLRTSNAWRVLLPGAVILGCIALIAVPLLILVPLLVNSLDPSSHTYGLLWLWISMIVLELAVAALVIWGLTKIFLTQAGNYPS
jgi:hypothetical protein